MAMNNLTRGGQVFAHDVRMLVQVLKTTLLLSSSLSILVFALIANFSLFKLYVLMLSGWAEIKLAIGEVFYGNGAVIQLSLYSFKYQQWQLWSAERFLHLPIVQQLQSQVWDMLTSPKFYLQLLLLPALSSLVVLGLFYYKGRKVRQTTHSKGVELVSVKALKRILRSKKLLSRLHLDGAPLVKDRETSHMLIAGTTGAGKSNCFNHLLPQLRSHKAIIVDLTGEYVARYFDENRDILLNPTEGQTWDLWADANDVFDYNALAESFIGTASHNHDAFWLESAKSCLAAAFEKLAPQRDIGELLDQLTKTPLSEFSQFLSDTGAAAFADSKGERTTVSIRATIVSKIKSLETLRHKPPQFSINEWISTSQPGWLFLYAPPAQRELLCPMIAAQISTAIKALMQLPPDSDRRCWFILDELPALNKLAALPMLLAEGRKYGACVVAGIQDFAQLDLRYGVKQAQTILNQLNTKVIFRFTDPNGCQLAAKMLGECEQIEAKENISYGANTMRDGVNLVNNTNRGFTVMPTEIATLANLECYLRLPEHFPITKHQMTFNNGDNYG